MVMIRLLHLSCPRVVLVTTLRSMLLLSAGGQAQTQASYEVPGRRRGGRRCGRTQAWAVCIGNVPAIVSHRRIKCTRSFSPALWGRAGRAGRVDASPPYGAARCVVLSIKGQSL